MAILNLNLFFFPRSHFLSLSLNWYVELLSPVLHGGQNGPFKQVCLFVCFFLNNLAQSGICQRLFFHSASVIFLHCEKFLREFRITHENRKARIRRCYLYVRNSGHIWPGLGPGPQGKEAMLAPWGKASRCVLRLL